MKNPKTVIAKTTLFSGAWGKGPNGKAKVVVSTADTKESECKLKRDSIVDINDGTFQLSITVLNDGDVCVHVNKAYVREAVEARNDAASYPFLHLKASVNARRKGERP